MSFSSSICITNIGTLPLGCNVSIYSDTNNYSTPFQIDIPLSQLTSNCPYILTNIPPGTRFIKIEETTSHCCATLELKSINLCELFGIQLAGFSSTTVSQIVAGLLVGSVGATITDYIIDWYGPDNNTTVAFTSGYGTSFNNVPYQQTHPFTRISLPGYYVPMIRQIRVNGVNYSITGGTGFVQANIDCLENQTVAVFPSTCSGNREEPILYYPNYNNYYFSNTSANNTPPESLSMGFDLDINSNYFAWQFKAYTVSDTIKITFYGDNYSTPIVLEYYTIGEEYTDTNISIVPKTIRAGGFFKKITLLTKLLRSENDYLTIEVTPNPIINRTDWVLYFKCLTTFNCETCVDTLSPYKFLNSSVLITPLSCGRFKWDGNVKGCTSNVLYTSDIYKYLIQESDINTYFAGNSEIYGYCATQDGIINITQTASSGETYCNSVTVCDGNSCSEFPLYCDGRAGGFISFKKTNNTVGGPGNVYMEFQYLSDLTLYYNSYLENVFNLGLGTPFDNTDINYYRNFKMIIPLIPSTDPNRTCASDINNQIEFNFHTSSVVTTGITGNSYFLNMTMPLMTLGINFQTCELNCLDYAQQLVESINNISISEFNQYDFYSNVGAKKLNPIGAYVKLRKQSSNPSLLCQSAFIRLTDFIVQTIPMSGDTYTVIPSLSAQTCSLSGYLNGGSFLNITRYYKNAWQYCFSITSLNHYEVYTTGSDGLLLLIYEYDLNANKLLYIDLNYFLGPNITLSSSTVSNGSLIPIGFNNNTNCGQLNNSPAMSWTINSYTSGTTQTITSYEILCEDINATGSSPDGYFVHWYVTGITSGQTSISVNGSWAGSPTIIPTDYGSGDRANGWNGPCPPSGTHNYRVQVKAKLSDNTTLTSNYLTFTSTTP